MNERPILFSAPMVIARREGRKTQTRRIINPQPIWVADPSVPFKTTDADPMGIINCPYGKPGDLLYIKETAWMWCEKKPNGITKTGKPKWLYEPLREAPVVYCADHPDKPQVNIAHEKTGNEWGWRKKIGRFLPRWASRTTLEIVSVRVERLQDISEEDAIAEGLKVCHNMNGRVGSIGYVWPDSPYDKSGLCHSLLVTAFGQGWEIINGPGAWDLNPFVWVVEFRTLEIARAAA